MLQHAVIMQAPMPVPIPAPAADIAIAFFTTVMLTIVLFPVARALARRLDRPRVAAPDRDVTVRLDRIEQAVESIAIEVERISEGQRFTTQVLASLKALPQPNAAEQVALDRAAPNEDALASRRR